MMNTVDIKTINYDDLFNYVDNVLDELRTECYNSNKEGKIEIRRLSDGRYQVSLMIFNDQMELPFE